MIRPTAGRIGRAVPGTALAALVVVLLAVLLPAVRAVRASSLPLDDEKHTECFIDKDDVLSPGLSIRPSSGTAVTPAPGTIECHGKINGHDPTGNGQVTEHARYGTKDPDTCQDGGEGDGKFEISLPTNGGVQTFTLLFTFTYGEPSTRGGVVAGKFTGQGFHGTFDATPKEGDCVTKPVTRIHTVDEVEFDDGYVARP
jgi:hypothetical protein